MTPEEWLAAARANAAARGLSATIPVLEAFAGAMRALRAAPWNDSAAGPRGSDPGAPTDERR